MLYTVNNHNTIIITTIIIIMTLIIIIINNRIIEKKKWKLWKARKEDERPRPCEAGERVSKVGLGPKVDDSR